MKFEFEFCFQRDEILARKEVSLKKISTFTPLISNEDEGIDMSLVTCKNINYHQTDSIEKQNKERRENGRPTELGGWCFLPQVQVLASGCHSHLPLAPSFVSRSTYQNRKWTNPSLNRPCL